MVIVTGAKGQLGSDIVSELARRNIEHIGIDVGDLDITDEGAVKEYFEVLSKQRRKPAAQGDCVTSPSGPLTETAMTKNGQICVIHCAAYTAVDKAEDEKELCFKVNAAGTENLAKACRRINAQMIYISTDYVFSGEGDTPYETDAVKAPLSTYGKSKLAGEEAVLHHLEKYYIVRTSWVFGHNGANFVKTILRLCETKNEISVIDDQTGSPTYTPDLAKLLCDMALSDKYGIYHATNEGFCSWAQFAEEIVRLKAAGGGIISDEGIAGQARNDGYIKINHIATEEYPAKAQRPKNSRLSKKSLDDAGFERLPAWQNALMRYMEKL